MAAQAIKGLPFSLRIFKGEQRMVVGRRTDHHTVFLLDVFMALLAKFDTRLPKK